MKFFTIESWNHPCFGPNYHMVWGPYPIKMWNEIDTTLIKNFDKQVKFLKYKHDEVRS